MFLGDLNALPHARMTNAKEDGKVLPEFVRYLFDLIFLFCLMYSTANALAFTSQNPHYASFLRGVMYRFHIIPTNPCSD